MHSRQFQNPSLAFFHLKTTQIWPFGIGKKSIINSLLTPPGGGVSELGKIPYFFLFFFLKPSLYIFLILIPSLKSTVPKMTSEK